MVNVDLIIYYKVVNQDNVIPTHQQIRRVHVVPGQGGAEILLIIVNAKDAWIIDVRVCLYGLLHSKYVIC